MKKYKLIKIYPGYSDLGMIAEETKGGGIEFTRSDGSQYTHSSSGEKLFESRIKPYPEYWQLIEEKYQILSFINSDNTIFKIQPNGLFKDESVDWDYGFEEGWRTLNHILTEATDCKIHSVKRLSDGEIFTIGDKCNLYNGNGHRNPIIKIELTKNGTSGHLEEYRNRETIKITLGTGYTSLDPWGPFEFDKIVKSKIPLFTTEDGVDIFDGDTAYAVGLRDIEKDNIYSVNKKYSISDGYYKWFSTPEKAKEYTFINKSCLSLNDLLNCWGDNSGDKNYYKDSLLYKRFEKFVKQKLNK